MSWPSAASSSSFAAAPTHRTTILLHGRSFCARRVLLPFTVQSCVCEWMRVYIYNVRIGWGRFVSVEKYIPSFRIGFAKKQPGSLLTQIKDKRIPSCSVCVHTPIHMDRPVAIYAFSIYTAEVGEEIRGTVKRSIHPLALSIASICISVPYTVCLAPNSSFPPRLLFGRSIRCPSPYSVHSSTGTYYFDRISWIPSSLHFDLPVLYIQLITSIDPYLYFFFVFIYIFFFLSKTSFSLWTTMERISEQSITRPVGLFEYESGCIIPRGHYFVFNPIHCSNLSRWYCIRIAGLVLHTT